MAGLPRRADVVYSVLTPNMKGFEGALAAGANEVVVFRCGQPGLQPEKHQLFD